METRIPGGPHIKTRGIAALGFQTNITHFLCCLRDRGHGGLSPEDLPRYHLPPAHRPIPQEPLKANVSQGEGVAFLHEVNSWWPQKDPLHVYGDDYLKICFSISSNPYTDSFPWRKTKPHQVIFLLRFKSLYMRTSLSRCSPCFEDNPALPTYLPHTAQFSLL